MNRKKAFGTLYAKESIAPEEQLATVTADELEEQAEFEAQRTAHHRAGESLQHPNPGSNAYRFTNSLHCINRNTMGSNEARIKSRSDAFAMSMAMGAFHSFITMNNYDLGNPYLMDLCSDEPLGLTTAIRSSNDLVELRIPIKSLRRGLVSKNPAMTAYWFDTMTKVFLEEVLGFCWKDKRTARDGLFGPIKAYHGATEEQVRYWVVLATIPGCSLCYGFSSGHCCYPA